MRHIAYLFIFLMPLFATAQEVGANFTKLTGDSLYIAGDYDGAVAVYETLIATEGENATVYYNLANAYYKTDEIAKAILNYERAALLAPSDKDIRFNLALVQSKIIDKVSEPYEIFFMQWIKNIVNLFPMDVWTIVGVIAFLLLLFAVFLFLFTGRAFAKKAGFFIGIIALFVTIFANAAAYHHYYCLTHRTEAIVMQPSVTAKSTPDASGTDLFIIHEGRKVNIVDDTMQGWKEIELEDGTLGWVPVSTIERI